MSDIDWILPALASPVIFAAVSLGDKLIISRQGLRLGGFFLFVATAQLLIAAVIMAVKGWPADAPVTSLLASYAGGLLWGLALMLMFLVLRREEVSRVTPVWQSSPIFAAIFAVLALGESLAWHGWLAVLLVVTGAVAVSAERGKGGLAAFALRPTFFLLIAGAVLVALGQLLLKVGSEDLNVWHNMAFRGTGLFTAMGLPWARPQYVSALFRWARNPVHALSITLTEGAGPFAGNLFLLIAIENGPVSLVSALLGARPIFVLAGTLALGAVARDLLGERITRSDVTLKVAATAAVVAGIVIISVFG